MLLMYKHAFYSVASNYDSVKKKKQEMIILNLNITQSLHQHVSVPL